jgi:hypothetical protein
MNRQAVLLADDTRISVLRWTRRFLLIASLWAGVSSILPAQSLTLTSAGQQADSSILLNLSLSTPSGSQQPAALEFAFSYPSAAISSFSVAGGTALTAPQKSLFCNWNAANYICVAVGLNANTISDGVVAAVSLKLASGVNTTSFSVVNPASAGSPGNALAVNVASAPSVACSLSVMSFAVPLGGLPPADETCVITTTPAGLGLSVAAGAASWLSASLSAQTSPAILTVSANPAGLAGGLYRSAVTVSAAGPALNPAGNATGASATVTIDGGVGSTAIPVNMIISSSTMAPASAKFSQIGIFRPSTPVGAAQGVFALDADGNNVWNTPPDKTVAFGLAGDIPVAGDWEGTGVVRIGVYRPSNATWYLDMNNNGRWDPGVDLAFTFGIPSATCTPNTAADLAACGDIPIAGDWGGTGVTKVGIFRGGAWFLDLNNNHTWDPGTDGVYSYGQPGDLPVVANWSGTGTADQIGVFRAGIWYVDSNGDGIYEATDAAYAYGMPGDIPATGNWNGAGPRKIGVFRCSAGTGGCQWILNTNGSGVFSAADLITSYGLSGDTPVVGFWTIS